MAGGNIGDLLLRALVDMTGFEAELVKGAEKAGDKAGEKAGKSMGQRLSSAASKVMTALGAATGAAAVGALRLGETYDQAFDTIRIGTGATGDAFEGLKKDFASLMGTVPDDVGVASQVFADLQTRTGLVGDGLKNLTKTILDLSRLTGTDAVANVKLATRVFGDWSIATEDQEGALDKLFRASQATGIGIDQLMTQVVQFGAPLRAMGFSMEEAAVIFGKFEKEGVNAELVMGSMRIALGKFAKAGLEPKQALQATIAEIQRLGPGAAATGLAMETFGARAGADMAAAILEGRFALGDLFDAVADGTDTIADLTTETEDVGDAWKKLKNQIGAAIGPFASVFGDLASSLGPVLYTLPLLGAGIGRMAAAALSAGPKIIAGLIGPLKALPGLLSKALIGPIGGALESGFEVGAAQVAKKGLLSKAGGVWGKVFGSALGKAGAVAFAAVMVVEVINTYNRIRDGLNEMTAQINTDVGNQIREGTTESLQQSADALRAEIGRAHV